MFSSDWSGIIKTDGSKTLQEIIESFGENRLNEYLSNLWKTYAPKNFTEKSLFDKDRTLDDVLISPLERFLTKSQYPDAEFEDLKKANSPKVMCGKRCELGETVYRCVECAYDSACSFCSECFQNSIHKEHEYQIQKSVGGYCDCGDVECWKSGHACDMHKEPDQSDEQVEDPEVLLKADMKLRAEQLFEAVMLFSHAALTSSENETTCGIGDTLPQDKNCCCTLLTNSDFFTSDQVLHILINALSSCSIEDCDAYIAKLKENGKVCIQKGERSECEQVADFVVEESMKTSSHAMEVKVMNYEAVVQQEVAYDLLRWIRKIINISDGLKSVFYRVMVRSNGTGGPLSMVEKFFLDDTKISKVPRTLCHRIYTDAIVRNPGRKAEIAVIFTRHYPALISSLLKAKHQISIDSSVTNLATQLYARPSVIKMLVLKHNVIELILKSVLTEIKAWKENGILVFKHPNDCEHFKLLLESFHHLGAILSMFLIGLEWTDDSRGIILNGFRLFLEFLYLIEEMDAAKVPIKGSEEFKEKLEVIFIIHISVRRSSNAFIKLCSSDEEVLKRSCIMILNKLRDPPCNTDIGITMKGHYAKCCSFVIQDDCNPTTIYLPIYRLLATLYIKLPDGISYRSDCFAPLNQQIVLSEILEYPLRVLVLLAQVESQMWMNKGQYFVKQMMKYKNREFRQEMFDRDIQLLQIVASLMEPNEFIIHLLHKFNLMLIFGGSSQSSLGCIKKSTKDLIDNFLLLLIIITGERYDEGVGCIDKEAAMKREIVHRLAFKDISYTDIKEEFSSLMDPSTAFEANLRVVARVGEDQLGDTICKLRPEYYDWFNPCFYHYSSSERSEAEIAQRYLRAKKNLSSVLPIPKPPRLHTKLQALAALLTCDITLHIMISVITDVLHKKTATFSEVHLEKVLHLMTIGLHEDKILYDAGDTGLRFTKALQETIASEEQKTIIGLLQQCSHEQAKKSTKALCDHILETWRNLLTLKNNCVLQ